MEKINSHWLICPNSVEVKCFTTRSDQDANSFEFVIIDQGIVMGIYGCNPPLMKTRQKMQIDDARKYWQKLIKEGWQKTKPQW
tara:strand:- start:96 stop:344 length:249 start_codon:yes stop_codon:yes gene_type:complete